MYIVEKKQLGALLATVNNSKLNFSYETLERATNYFADSNKLGQGGSGSVYKVSAYHPKQKCTYVEECAC